MRACYYNAMKTKVKPSDVKSFQRFNKPIINPAFKSSVIRNELGLINESDWRKFFEEDIRVKLEEAKNELEEYKRTGYIIYLQQACNKLFSALENQLMLKYNKKTSRYKELQMVIGKNHDDQHLLRDARHLHIFFYKGDLDMSKEDAESEFNRIYGEVTKGATQ